MGAGQAAAILRRRATPEERAAFEADYAERLLNPYVAAERGYIDAVIDPAETRAAVAAAFEGLDDKREAAAAAQARQRTVLRRAVGSRPRWRPRRYAGHRSLSQRSAAGLLSTRGGSPQ